MIRSLNENWIGSAGIWALLLEPHRDRSWKDSLVPVLLVPSRHDRLTEDDLRLIPVDDRLILDRPLLHLSVAKVVVRSDRIDLCSRIRVSVAEHDGLLLRTHIPFVEHSCRTMICDRRSRVLEEPMLAVPLTVQLVSVVLQKNVFHVAVWVQYLLPHLPELVLAAAPLAGQRIERHVLPVRNGRLNLLICALVAAAFAHLLHFDTRAILPNIGLVPTMEPAVEAGFHDVGPRVVVRGLDVARV